jgi:hypothetical protein
MHIMIYNNFDIYHANYRKIMISLFVTSEDDSAKSILINRKGLVLLSSDKNVIQTQGS